MEAIVKVRDTTTVVGVIPRLPEADGLVLELLLSRWVSGRVGKPTLDHPVLERECTVDETGFLEILLEVEALDHTTVLFGVKVELEFHGLVGFHFVAFLPLFDLPRKFCSVCPHYTPFQIFCQVYFVA